MSYEFVTYKYPYKYTIFKWHGTDALKSLMSLCSFRDRTLFLLLLLLLFLLLLLLLILFLLWQRWELVHMAVVWKIEAGTHHIFAWTVIVNIQHKWSTKLIERLHQPSGNCLVHLPRQKEGGHRSGRLREIGTNWSHWTQFGFCSSFCTRQFDIPNVLDVPNHAPMLQSQMLNHSDRCACSSKTICKTIFLVSTLVFFVLFI